MFAILCLNGCNCYGSNIHVLVYLQGGMFVGQIKSHAVTIHICTKGLPFDYVRVVEVLSTDGLGNAERLPNRRGIAFGLHRIAFWVPLVLPWDRR